MSDSLRARDVMTRDVTTVKEDMPVEELIGLFRVSHFSGVPVVDDAGRAIGVVSESDILRAMAYACAPPGSGEFKVQFQAAKRGISGALLEAVDNEDLHALALVRGLLQRNVHDVMTPVVHACSEDDLLALVCETMAWKEVHRMIVTDADQSVVGLISALDAVRVFGEHLRKTHGDVAKP